MIKTLFSTFNSQERRGMHVTLVYVFLRRHPAYRARVEHFMVLLKGLNLTLSLRSLVFKWKNSLIKRIDCYHLENFCTSFFRFRKRTVSMLKQFLFDYWLDQGIDILVRAYELKDYYFFSDMKKTEIRFVLILFVMLFWFLKQWEMLESRKTTKQNTICQKKKIMTNFFFQLIN